MIAKEIKPGQLVVYQNDPCLVKSLNVQSPSARGAATLYKFRTWNLRTKQKVDITLKGGESLDVADFARRPVKYMYADATHRHFLDQQDYNQYSLPVEDVAEEAQFLTEELEGVMALIYNDECIGVEVPQTVVLKVTQCDPGVKGNSATGRTKPATLETGLVVNVPEYLGEGELIKIDTRTAEFLSRA
ncbi:MAG: elongation factor P [Pirellulales bacterium]|nr:elongation factor P [Pirellulales bacterium]